MAGGEEPPTRGVVEGEWIEIDFGAEWQGFAPQSGDILELATALVPGHQGSTAVAALLVTSVRKTGEGSLEWQGRIVGRSDDAVGKELSNLVNRRHHPLHLCWHVPCTFAEEDGVIHVTRARWWERGSFDAPYLRAWGRLVIKEYDTLEEGEAPKPGPKRAARRKPGTGKGLRKPAHAGAGNPPARRRAVASGTPGALKEKLKGLREKLLAEKRKGGEKPILVHDSEDSEGSTMEDSNASDKDEEREEEETGGRRRPVTSLALQDVKREEPEKDLKSSRLKKTRRRKVKRPRDPGLQLLAQAAQRGEAREEEERSKKEKKRKGSGNRGVKALVAALTGREKEKKEKRDGKKKRKRKSRGAYDPPGDSSGSSEYEEESSGSESSEMLAPLQKKSQKKPGTVLRMLVHHAKQALDQSAVIETKQVESVTGGVKLGTYFNLLVRPYHAVSSRDMKEMNHLAVCLDELRAGELGKLGDSLASRFLAIHTAVNDGSWRAAQYLELHPLEPTQGAPTSLLLEARRHGKLVNKSLGTEEWRRPRGESEGWKGGGKGDAKGKGKGKGKDWSRQGKGGEASWQGRGGGWNKNRNWWEANKEKADGKDSKGGEKDAKKADK